MLGGVQFETGGVGPVPYLNILICSHLLGGGPVSKSRCKMFKYFHKGFQYLNFFGGTSQKKHPVPFSTFSMQSLDKIYVILVKICP